MIWPILVLLYIQDCSRRGENDLIFYVYLQCLFSVFKIQKHFPYLCRMKMVVLQRTNLNDLIIGWRYPSLIIWPFLI